MKLYQCIPEYDILYQILHDHLSIFVLHLLNYFIFIILTVQLEGGIHRYLETFPDGGRFQGKNFVFDSRVAVGPAAAAALTPTAANENKNVDNGEAATHSDTIVEDVAESAAAAASVALAAAVAVVVAMAVVGRCIDCAAAHERYSGHIVCTVCRMPVLVCDSCVRDSTTPGEYHCSRHR